MITNDALIERLTEYKVAVKSWNYVYSYIAEPKSRLEVSEFIHLETLEFQGVLSKPRSRIGAPAHIRVACEKPIKEGELRRYDRPVVGNVTVHKGLVEAYILLPPSHVSRLVSAASSGRINCASLAATRMFRRKALIRSFHAATARKLI